MVSKGLSAASCVAPTSDAREHRLTRLYLPATGNDGRHVVATADTSAENLSWLRAAYPGARIVGASKKELLTELDLQFGASLAEDAVCALARTHPSLSAKTVITRKQACLISLAAIIAVAVLATRPPAAYGLFTGVLSAGFIAGTIFRTALAWIGGTERDVCPPLADDDSSLPVYTILVPLYREANVLPGLIEALLLLDYPKDKLDIKLIVEADDRETVAVAEGLEHRGPFQVVRVPPGTPRTKPRACNYAFPFARGEFTVIYDAEDRPERDQLRKAIAQFRRGQRSIACLQARLNFYNANENWLTRLFALDYALWFDVLMPGLEKLRVPMPLGGTSNHFRTSALKTVGAWDPFNVTEDADLGIRLAQMGMRVAMLNSTTFEESPTTLGAWLKQRSRWLKGYMQTWLVHMRDPAALRRRTGWRRLVSLQLFLGGSVISALVNPLLWLMFVSSGHFGVPAQSPLAELSLTSISAIGLVGGNAMLTWLAIIAPQRRGWNSLAPYGLTVTLYWGLISLAAWRALWQLITRPFHWEKTAHGLSRLGQNRS